MSIESSTCTFGRSMICAAAAVVLVLATAASYRQYIGINDHDDTRRIDPLRLSSSSSSTASTADFDVSTSTSSLFDDQSSIHPQCYRGKTSDELKNRPLLLFKYARTGSTWLARTGETLLLASNNDDENEENDDQQQHNMYFVSEAEGCGDIYSDQLAEWFTEFFTGNIHGTLINRSNNHKSVRESNFKGLGVNCVRPAKHGMGPVMIATIDWKNDTPHPDPDHYTIDLTAKQYRKLFDAVPNLAIGVLTRTNSVKRAISSIAAEDQVRICGEKKLTGKEHCIKNLPERLHLDPEYLFEHIKKNDGKSVRLPQLAAELSDEYSDGRIFCVTYESMQNDMASEMEALGEYIGANIAPESIAALREDQNKRSYKRGSDDLSEYIENYEEVRESLTSYPCILEQLESVEPKNFPPCNLKEEIKKVKLEQQAARIADRNAKKIR